MKIDIKELLECFSSDDIHLIQCEHKWCDAYGYEKSQMKKDLLDYITNLQEDIGNYVKITLHDRKEIDRLQQDLDKANDIIEKDRQFYKCRMDEYVELKKEKKRLTSLCVGHEKELRTKDIIIKQIRMEANNYKSRCEKAIKSIDIVEEIIKKQPDDFGNGDMWILKRLEGFKFILNRSDEK